VTSTYFEGAADFPLAQRGYSRDQRSDCKQVCIGLVVSRCGMPKSMLKKFEQEILKEDWHSIRDGLEVKIVPWPKSGDDETSTDTTTAADASPERFILCRSRERSKKEEGITQRFEKKIEAALISLKAGCEKQARDRTGT
jgi:transposase